MKSRRKPPKSTCVCSFTQISDGVTNTNHSFMSVDLLGVLWSFMCVHQVPTSLPPSLHFVFHALTQDRCHVYRAWLLREAAPRPAAASTNHAPACLSAGAVDLPVRPGLFLLLHTDNGEPSLAPRPFPFQI